MRTSALKIITITSKHHDGFCLFRTKETDFNSVNSPAGLDLMGEIAESCEKTLEEQAVKAMQKAARFFCTEVATNGGYVCRYKIDFSMREAAFGVPPKTISIWPESTPAVGMDFL